jgi:hypothetical protein
MKLYLLIGCLVASVIAAADGVQRYDQKALRLLTEVSQACPVEMAKAMERANIVKSAVQTDLKGATPETYKTILVITTAYTSFMGTFDVAQLKITKEYKPREIPLPDAGPLWTTTCELKEF